MKLKKLYIFGFTAFAALLLPACGNVAETEIEVPSQMAEEEKENIVTLSVLPPELSIDSRGGETVEPFNTISDGSKADALIFAVYEASSENGPYTLAKNFKKELDAEDLPASKLEAGEGQNILDITTGFWPLKLRLATQPKKYYKVAFWAQNSDCDAFKTTNLTKVEVRYALNNDELRDAFCAVSPAFIGSTQQQVETVLKRPFAQINVGTTGADYKNLMIGEKMYPNKIVQESRISVKGAYTILNIVNNSVSGKIDNETVLGFYRLPAYVNMESLPGKDESQGNKEDQIKDLLYIEGEEMLYVKLNDSETDPLAYKTDYPTLVRNEEGKVTSFLTETFKYMSMCYVLVPSGEGSTVDVKVSFRELSSSGALTPISISNVPVRQNWRTNILGGLSNEDDDEPEDPTSLFNSTLICVHLDPLYQGENNSIFDGKNSWIKNEFPGSNKIDRNYVHSPNE